MSRRQNHIWDNPTDQQFHASLSLGFTDTNALRAFFGSAEIATLSRKLG